MATILIVVLVLLLIGAVPTWPHSRGWGYYPSGLLGLVLLILLILALSRGVSDVAPNATGAIPARSGASRRRVLRPRGLHATSQSGHYFCTWHRVAPPSGCMSTKGVPKIDSSSPSVTLIVASGRRQFTVSVASMTNPVEPKMRIAI
jgi:uncharacterized protein DUF3309